MMPYHSSYSETLNEATGEVMDVLNKTRDLFASTIAVLAKEQNTGLAFTSAVRALNELNKINSILESKTFVR